MLDSNKQNNNEIRTVKSLGGNRIGGLLVAFGSPNDCDLEGQYFTKDTNFELDWYSVRPVLYGHGMDSSHKTTAIGIIDKIETTDEGLWAEAQLRSHYKYRNTIEKMLAEGMLAWSSGSSPYYAEADRNGFIRTWPIHEGSLTEKPAQPGKTLVKTIKHHIDIHSLKRAVDELGLQDYNIDDLILKYKERPNSIDENNERSNKKEPENSAEKETPAEKYVIPPEQSDRPIEITSKIYLVNESKEQNKDMKMNDELSKQQDKKGNTPEITVTSQSTEEKNPSVSPQPLKRVEYATATLEEVVDPATQEVSDSFLKARISDAMLVKEIPVNEDNVKDAIAKIKQWIRNRTLTSIITKELTENAWMNNEFHKFYKELVESYRPQPQETAPIDQETAIKAAVEQALKQREREILGMGGVSKAVTADFSEADNSAIHSFFYIPDASEKAKYANHGLEDLVYYAYLRSMASRKHFLDRPWNLDEQDHLYEAIFQTGKDVIPEIARYIPNWNWHEVDDPREEIHAVKAFRAMHAFKGKAIKAQEVLATPHIGRGSDWIYTLSDGTLWNTLLEQHMLFNAIPKFNMMAGKVEQYIDDEMGMASLVPEIVDAGASATVRKDAANSLGNYPITPPGTQNITFTARHIGQQTVISKIEIEDAKIDAVSSARKQLHNALQRAMVWSVLNAHDDLTGSDNYGHYGETVGGDYPEERGLAGIGFNGMIARALTDTHKAGYQAGADQCVDFLTATRRLMSSRYYSNHSQIRIVMQPARCDLLWDLEDFKRASQQKGSWDGGSGNPFTVFQGTPIITSEQVNDRDSEGKRQSTAASNTRGVIVFFRPDRMKIGIRRRNTRSMSEYGRYQEHLSIGESLRFDFQMIPHAHEPGQNSAVGGSGLKRKPVSVLYDLN